MSKAVFDPFIVLACMYVCFVCFFFIFYVRFSFNFDANMLFWCFPSKASSRVYLSRISPLPWSNRVILPLNPKEKNIRKYNTPEKKPNSHMRHPKRTMSRAQKQVSTKCERIFSNPIAVRLRLAFRIRSYISMPLKTHPRPNPIHGRGGGGLKLNKTFPLLYIIFVKLNFRLLFDDVLSFGLINDDDPFFDP